jgi:hypothetical protein
MLTEDIRVTHFNLDRELWFKCQNKLVSDSKTPIKFWTLRDTMNHPCWKWNGKEILSKKEITQLLFNNKELFGIYCKMVRYEYITDLDAINFNDCYGIKCPYLYPIWER